MATCQSCNQLLSGKERTMSGVPKLCTTCDIFLCHAMTDGDILHTKPLFRNQPNEYYYAFLQNACESEPWTWAHLYWYTRAFILSCGRRNAYFPLRLDTIEEIDDDDLI